MRSSPHDLMRPWKVAAAHVVRRYSPPGSSTTPLFRAEIVADAAANGRVT